MDGLDVEFDFGWCISFVKELDNCNDYSSLFGLFDGHLMCQMGFRNRKGYNDWSC